MSRRTINGLDLWVEEGGAGEPTLLLVHGLGCTGAVWDGLRPILEARWPGRWIVPDLRGHGRSDHAPIYGIAHYAADLAVLAADAEKLFVLGHSMGGQAGMALASGLYGVAVTHVVALGVKPGWTADEIARAHDLAGTPVRWFDGREAAIERFLRVAGLAGIAAPDSALARSGVVAENGHYRLAADMRINGVAGSDTRTVRAAALRRAGVTMACGGDDAMAPPGETRAIDREAVVLPGLGHNAHVEDPSAMWSLIADHFEFEEA